MKTKPKTHLPCPKCNSSDAFSIQDNGWGKCFSCGTNIKVDNNNMNDSSSETMQIATQKRETTPFTDVTEVYRPFKDRGLTKETIERYKIHVGNENDNFLAKYPLFDAETGKHQGNKVRYKDKGFSVEGDFVGAGLFGKIGRASCRERV